jgi:Rod binding domain-containing protein
MQINLAHPQSVRPLRSTPQSHDDELAAARQLQSAYREFVGKTFFGQLLKSMRQTVGKPAYFHGGQTEEVFRSQLDGQLADHMTTASAAQFADPMFRQQFPRQAALLAADEKKAAADMTDLNRLRRR